MKHGLIHVDSVKLSLNLKCCLEFFELEIGGEKRLVISVSLGASLIPHA